MNHLSLIVGLGNPGAEYAQTRHNAGFWYVEQLAERYNIQLKNDNKYNAISGRGQIEGHDVRLLLPLTYMNRSGQSVVPFAKFYQIPTNQILIAHDELDMNPGVIRLKNGGGHGGHNGLRDIVPHLGADFLRLRIGIGHPGSKDRVSGHVLSKAAKNEQNLMDQAIDHALTQTKALAQGDIAKAMNAINAFKAT
ncbi:aminoacyl-tRNA hydrolase [Acinetobacter qingfengensis]|uniref:Peptidyl-tRNA hydrolase n=1 Tax=Acinetobacter qingfengensis TaxID=1262585 RepID=A0A1E7RFH9_9GAMM|nr:aminoacyl-tRNA hydrolase [Acinetobacter qingfengensis]KAA8732808.1 aminoacyl-tRNA hydrolase [Acinetobacter qingfengensis]OEY98081.1 aminoacyl-tRNA hydrolase [Acinetobacter qingfengensis]